MTKVISLSLVLLLTIILSASSNTFSANELSNARCAIPKFEKAYENAKAVFVGKVLSKKSEGDLKAFELEVEKYWKGVEEKKITINVYENPRYQAQFEVGKSYLVFAEADEDSGKLFDRRCSRTKLVTENSVENLSEDLEKLGDAKTCISLSKEGNN
jgi:hypothetical protein